MIASVTSRLEGVNATEGTCVFFPFDSPWLRKAGKKEGKAEGSGDP
jgi:hypothetical protein